jgi:HSP20 family protein
MLIWRRAPLLTGSFEDEQIGAEVDWRPDLDVFELPDEFRLCVSLPGVRPEDVEVTVVGRRMTVAGVRRSPFPDGAVAHLIESARGRFERRVRLSANSDISSIRTEMADGQLLVRIPKAPSRSLTVTVRTGR